MQNFHTETEYSVSPDNIAKRLPRVFDLIFYTIFGTEFAHTWCYFVIIVTWHSREQTVMSGGVIATDNIADLLMFNLVVEVAGEPIPKWSGVCVSCSPQLANGNVYTQDNKKE